MLRTFEEILPRVSADEVAAAAQRVLNAKGTAHYVYTSSLIRKLKEDGRLLIAVSGSIRDVADPFAKSLGFDVVVCSDLEIVDSAYTGKRVRQTNKNKDKLLREVVEGNDATFEDSVGVGDTHRDIPLLELTTHPIAFNPNAALFEEADKRGWKIVVERKNMIYELVKSTGGYTVESVHPNYSGPHQEQLQ
ncbi:HAD-IB family phosphatase [Candidatus Kaiserbacteria bacterium]|nr:HAD-IB family phosphatase [Candidatus Kaiserbacteria bacterium]